MVDKSDMYYGETSEAGKVRQLSQALANWNRDFYIMH